MLRNKKNKVPWSSLVRTPDSQSGNRGFKSHRDQSFVRNQCEGESLTSRSSHRLTGGVRIHFGGDSLVEHEAFGALAQFGRASRLHREGRGFESPTLHLGP